MTTEESFISDVGRVARILGRRHWFDAFYDPPLDHPMAALLFQAYYYDELLGTQLSKKTAAALVPVSDLKTARKYVALAVELRLLQAVQSKEDRRVYFLRPTSKLKDMVAHEIERMKGSFGERVVVDPSLLARFVRTKE